MSILSVIEADASKVLSFLTKTQSKTVSAGPSAVAGLATLLGSVATAVTSFSGAAAAGGLNIALDAETASNIKAVWPPIEALAADLGIKL